MQTSISGAGIQRPLVFFDLFHYPANEASAVTDSVWFPRTLSVRLVDRFSTPCRVSGLPALAALSRRCAAPQLVGDGARRAADLSGNGSVRVACVLEMLVFLGVQLHFTIDLAICGIKSMIKKSSSNNSFCFSVGAVPGSDIIILSNVSKKNKWFFHVSQPANNNIIIYHLIWAGQSLHFQGFRAVSAQMAVVFCPLRSSSSLVFRFGKTEQANGKGRLHSIKHNKEYVTSTVFQLL